MKLLHLLCSTIELVFGLSASVARLNLFFGCLDGSRFFKKPAGIVCPLLKLLVEFAFY